MSRSPLVASLVALFTVASCQDQPTGPEETLAPRAEILDARTGGTPGFFFLPPIAAADFVTIGTPDASLAPVVGICELSGTECGAAVARFTSQSRPAVQLNAARGAYWVDWNTSNYALDTAKTYRIRVLVAGAELGHADVRVVDDVSVQVIDPDFVKVQSGTTLSIRFRIEIGAV